MTFTLSDRQSEQISTGNSRWLVAWCTGCGGSCDGGGDCLESCDNVPTEIYADVTASAFQVQGENEITLVCWAFTMPLALVPSLGTGAAAGWHWIGTHVYEYAGASYLFSLDIGCDGQVTWLIFDDAGNILCTDSGAVVAPIPCGEIWDVEILDELGCTCDGVTPTLVIKVTE